MSLEAVIEGKRRFYRRITVGQERHIGEALRRDGIDILDGFLREIELVRAFFRAYYAGSAPRVVICGINPGRYGAGQTGLPFLDFHTLGRLLEGVCDMDGRRGRERSAAFVASVIDHFGPRRFFDNVYLTNLSWFGFVKEGRNWNHDRLAPEIQHVLHADFCREMSLVRPKVIVPTGRSVEEGLDRLREGGMLTCPVGPRLNHPNYCAFPTRVAAERRLYIETLTRLMSDPPMEPKCHLGLESQPNAGWA